MIELKKVFLLSNKEIKVLVILYFEPTENQIKQLKRLGFNGR